MLLELEGWESKLAELTEIQTLTLEQIVENTIKLKSELDNMIDTKEEIIEALPIMLDYSTAINYHLKKLQKEFRI